MTAAEKIQAAQAAAIRASNEHDQTVLTDVKAALERMADDAAIVAAAASDIITPYVGVHLTALATEHGRAARAIANALHEVTMALDAPTHG